MAAAAVVGLLIGSSQAVGAAEGVTTIDNFSPTGLKYVSAFPYVSDVSATFSTTDSDGICINANGTNWTLTVKDDAAVPNTVAFASGSFLKTAPPQPVCTDGFSAIRTIPGVSFPQPGTYTITGTLKTIQGTDLDLAESDTLELQFEQQVIVTYPAAPAVAAKWLDDNCQSSRYGSGKTGGNYISDVAGQMGPGTAFMGIEKFNVADYAAKVESYLTDRGLSNAC